MTRQELLDSFGMLRYGMSTNDKEAVAARGSLPGAPEDHTATKDKANRYAAGYLFARAHPVIAPAVQPTVNFIHGLAGDNPDLQAFAQHGMNNGLLQALMEKEAAKRAAVAQ